jgi:hypothetical protein
MPILKRLKTKLFSKKPKPQYRAPSHWVQLKRLLKGKPAHPNDEINYSHRFRKK